LTGVEKGVKNYSRGLGRNLKELAVKTLTFCHIEDGLQSDPKRCLKKLPLFSHRNQY